MPGTYIRTEEIKQKLRLANLGKKHSKETKKKLSEISKRRRHSEETKRKISESRLGDKNPNWKGDKVSYSGLHSWVQRVLGTPDTCEYCRRSKLSGYAIDWANKSRKYKRVLNDWIRLCKSCHTKYDKKCATL